MSEALKTRIEDGVLEVTLNRPKANAIDAATSREMGDLFADFRDNPDLRVAIITGGEGRFFSAGWDLKAAAEGESVESDYGQGGFAGLQELPNMNKPVIAAINGIACGGGFELAISCDMILAADTATFALPEIKAGTLADAATIKLPKRIPYHIAMDLLLTGRWIDAEEAHKWGLVNEIVTPENLMTRAWEVARLLASGPPLVFACIKETIRMTENVTTQEAFNMLHESKIPTMRTLYDSEDHHEGFNAFAEKRDPVWKGR